MRWFLRTIALALLASALAVARPVLAMAPVEKVVLVAEYTLPSGALVRVFELRLADGTIYYDELTISFGSSAAGRTALELKKELIRTGQADLLALPADAEIADDVIRQWQQEGYDWLIERESAARPRPEQEPAPEAPALEVVRLDPSRPQQPSPAPGSRTPAPGGQQSPAPAPDPSGQQEAKEPVVTPPDAEAAIHPGDEVLEDLPRQDREAAMEARKAQARGWLQRLLEWLASLWEHLLQLLGLR